MSEMPERIHLVGVGGMHMSAIALLLLQRGVRITGSDLRPSELTARVEAAGGLIFEGHAAENVGDAELVVTTAAAGDDNPEIVEARRRGIPVLLRAEMVARLMEDKRVIAVAGSHGKTTTSSLIAVILRDTGREPMYLLGGDSVDLGGHASWGGELCVVEADEYRRAFLEYSPEVGVITNVEADHLDYYGTAEVYEEAFADFGQRIVSGGRLYWCADDAGAGRVAERLRDAGVELIGYGMAEAATWRAEDISYSDQAVTFTVSRDGDPVGPVRALIPGEHFVRNATVAAAVCYDLGIPMDRIADAVERFRGARRRFERVGEEGGVTVMDDYAHHPTEVRATIATARQRFPDQRLFAVYQPHTYSRIAYLWDDWVSCWEGLDGLVVLETYAAREQPEAGRSAADLAAAITDVEAQYASTFEEAANLAAGMTQTGDVVFTIGAGDVNAVGPLLLEALR